MKYLSFGNASFHTSNITSGCKVYNARLRPDSMEECKIKSSANNNRPILQFHSWQIR